MHKKLLCLIAVLLLFAFAGKAVINVQSDITEKKACMEASESDEKTEKDGFKEKSEFIVHFKNVRLYAFKTEKALFMLCNDYFSIHTHFFAVPTPPPWQ